MYGENVEQLLKNVKEIDPNKTYVVMDDLIFADIEDAKEYCINDYEGLDDGMTDWYPEDAEEKKGIEIIREYIEETEEALEYYRRLYRERNND